MQIRTFADLGVIAMKGQPFIMYISTPTCQPCRRLKPLIEERIEPLIEVAYIDMVTTDPAVAQSIKDQGVTKVPTVFLVRINSQGMGSIYLELNNDIADIERAVTALTAEKE